MSAGTLEPEPPDGALPDAAAASVPDAAAPPVPMAGDGRRSAFRAPRWLASRHLQTLWPTLTRRPPAIELTRERLELPDGDFLDLDWAGEADRDAPVVVVLHGLGGSSRSSYARGMLAALAARGWRAVVMHFRGCSGEPNRLDRSYHSGDTGDLAHTVRTLRERAPGSPLAAVGFSLGGNVLLKWLGEQGRAAAVHAAVAVSVPFDLARAADSLDSGFARAYQWYLVRTLVHDLRAKFRDRPLPRCIDPRFGVLSSFWQFDDRVTAPLHGFDGVQDYYGRSSSRQFLRRIEVPTLLLQSRDDPFLPADALPRAEELGARVTLELSESGGHVGFVQGRHPGAARYWLEQRVPAFLGTELTRRQRPPSC